MKAAEMLRKWLRVPLTPVLALGLLALLSIGQATAQSDNRRLALVVGNATYDALPGLRNPTDDAEAVSEALSALGFTVFLTTNLNRAQFDRAIDLFLTRADQADTTLFYFAGHGATIGGESYLFPTDFGRASLYNLQESIGLTPLLARLGSRLRTNIVLIDACRENPLQVAVQADLQPAQSVLNSPARATGAVAPGQPPRVGTMVGFATTPGQVAYDGDGAHSPFTGALLDHLSAQHLDVEQMFKRVRRDVVVNTQGLQVPWLESSLLSEVYLGHPPGTRPSEQAHQARVSAVNTPLSAQLADTGFAHKALLTQLQEGLQSGAFVSSHSAKTPDSTVAVDRSEQIRALLCSVIDGPLPAECRAAASAVR